MFLRKIFLSILSAVLLFALSPAGQLEAAVAEEEVIEGLLPGSGAIAGWERDGEMISYMADDLWEYINGSAENFLAYNFQKVVAQHYVNGAGGEIKVEIYAHETPLMAFGIYSRYRTAESRFSDTGNESFGDDYSLHFWKGKYYVKISAYDEGNSSIEAFAQQVADRISEAGAVPEEIELLRVDGLSEKSITYLTGGVLGSGELPPAFTADYDIGGEKGKVFLFVFEKEGDGKRVFDWYALKGPKLKIMKMEKKLAFRGEGELPYRGRVVLFSYGKTAGIITGFAGSPGIADDLSGKLLEKIMTYSCEDVSG